MDNSLDSLPILESFLLLGCNFIIFGGNFHTGYWSAPLLNRLGLATRGTCVYIFLLSMCNVSKPLECALKFWHLACFILKIWDCKDMYIVLKIEGRIVGIHNWYYSANNKGMTIYIILLVGYCRVYNCKDISMFS